MTRDAVAFCDGLGLKQFHIVGFSLGGMIAQQLALDQPKRVQRMILLGTGPRGGEGMTFTELSAEGRADPIQFLLADFFTPSGASQQAGREYVNRLAARTRDRDQLVSTRAAEAQLRAIREWGMAPPTDRYAALQRIEHPTLIVHGNKDIVVQPFNAFILAQHLPNAQLIMYPDSSHGAHYQHAQLFLKHAKLLLECSMQSIEPSGSAAAPRESRIQVVSQTSETHDSGISTVSLSQGKLHDEPARVRPENRAR